MRSSDQRDYFKILLIACAAVAFIALAAMKPAQADHTPFIVGKTLGVQGLICDTAEQLKEIGEANLKGGSFAAGVAKFREINLRGRNAEGQVACGVVKAPMTIVRKVHEMEMFYPDGQKTMHYVVEVTIGGTTYFLLADKPVAQRHSEI